jgi:hypothetical protein
MAWANHDEAGYASSNRSAEHVSPGRSVGIFIDRNRV